MSDSIAQTTGSHTPHAKLVSVVTPFADGERELTRCIESVLAQSYRNFEYLLVDNQASPRARAIAESHAKRDPRIKLLRTAARLPTLDCYNFALDQLSEEAAYVKLVAERDWLYPNSLSDMIAVAEAHPRVAIVSSYWMQGGSVRGVGLDPECHVISGRDACRKHLLEGIFLFGSSALLYRAELLERRPFFTSGRLHADTEAVFEMLTNVDFGFVHQVLSCSHSPSKPAVPREFEPDSLDRFIIVSQYGPAYLESDEFRDCLKGATRWYYSVLARAWLAERFGRAPAGFWEYHRRGLKSIGEEVRAELLVAAMARLLTRTALAPLETLRGAAAVLARRSS
jgi:glycosyltransferase involved in cell wall biosynthesis